MRSPKETLELWLHFMNSHEADKLLELYHDDAINIQLAVGVPIVGKQALLEDFKAFFKHNPDTFTEKVNLFQDGEWAILEWNGGGTFCPNGKEALGTPFKLSGCGFFHVIDGRIKFQRGYWDMNTWKAQINSAS